MKVHFELRPLIKFFTSEYFSGRFTANNRQSVQTKTTPEKAAIDYLLFSYDFFRLAIPIKPISPEPNNQTAAGTGTSDTGNGPIATLS